MRLAGECSQSRRTVASAVASLARSRAMHQSRRIALLGLCLIFLARSWAPSRSFASGGGAFARGRMPVASKGSSEGHHREFSTSVQVASSDVGSPSPSDIGDAPERSSLVQAWGVLGVVAYLSYGVFKVIPIVEEGLTTIEEPWQWALLAVVLIFFAYVEGYKGFQNGFSPRVVSRAWVVSQETPDAPLWHKALAPAFCIGYFHGTTKRVITSWAVTSVIFAVVIGVRQLDNPYRAIIDAGVIVGLAWGIISIIVMFAQSVMSEQAPDYDPSLPEDTPYAAPSAASVSK